MVRRRVLPWEAMTSSSAASRRTVDRKPVKRDITEASKRKREPETASESHDDTTITKPRHEPRRYRPPPSSTQVFSSPSSSSSDTDPSDTHKRAKPPFLPTELMQQNDKAYRMVEDEFLETVHLFTAAVHEAELRLLESAGAKDTDESPRPALSSDDEVPLEEVRDEVPLSTLGTLMHAPRLSASRTPAPTKIKPPPPKPSPDSQPADAATHLAEPDRPPPEPASDNDDIMEIIRLTQVPSSPPVPSAAPSSSTSPAPTTAAAVAATATQSFDYDSDIDHFIRETAKTTTSEPEPKPKRKTKPEPPSTTSNLSTTTTDAPVSLMMHLLAQAEIQPDKTIDSRRPARRSRKPVFRYCL
ncbi:hypothetical protein BZA70DRAFT_279706 [Myxozyma melibiosi]|uniref:Uncharacterized protein n=1 Tax=Myxozyma melibiosi TaxID=54550 RepID=A0ABR1F4B6_9ASCO